MKDSCGTEGAGLVDELLEDPKYLTKVTHPTTHLVEVSSDNLRHLRKVGANDAEEENNMAVGGPPYFERSSVRQVNGHRII